MFRGKFPARTELLYRPVAAGGAGAWPLGEKLRPGYEASGASTSKVMAGFHPSRCSVRAVSVSLRPPGVAIT